MENSHAPTEASALSLEQRFALFFDAMIECWCEGGSPDGEDIQEIAHGLDLLTEVEFNSDIHDDHLGVGVEDGESWFVVSKDASLAVRLARAAQSSRKDGASQKNEQPHG